MLYIDSPAGVGYSLALNPEDYIHSDASTAKDALNAIYVFYEKFSEYLPNDLYLAGESYAGIYVPNLAYLIDK